MGVRAPRVLPARIRLQGYFVWDILDFLVNATLFVLIGLQLRMVVDALDGYSTGELAGVRPRGERRGRGHATRLALHRPVPDPRARQATRARSLGGRAASWRLVVGWSGMRGAVSLAVALAIPLETDAGGEFPQRDLIIFLTFAVIFFTLVVQGLSLPALIHRLGVTDDGADADEELRARLVATKAAIQQIDALSAEEWTRDETIERMRAMYEYRKRRLAARAGKIEDDGYEDRSLAYQQMVQIVLSAQREALIQLRAEGDLSNEAMNRILRELDLEESRLEI